MVPANLVSAFATATSPKRGKNERQGVHAWHPYYAGYSEGFVEAALLALGRDVPDPLVLDPWNGSGVTTLVTQRMGLRSVGVEINPIMVTFAKAKSLSLVEHKGALEMRARQVVEALETAPSIYQPHELAGWVPEEVLRGLLSLRDAILADRQPTLGCDLVSGPFRADRTTKRPHYDVETAFLLAALFRTLREYGSFIAGSNPTWVKKTEGAPVRSLSGLASDYQRTVMEMITDLEGIRPRRGVPAVPALFEGDARQLPLEDSSVDLIVTSPPYCTRIDYALSTKPELLLLGFRELIEIDGLRRRTMGAPVITDKTLVPRPEWGQSCRQVLAQVEAHSAKASRSYYYPNLLQYFSDAARSLQEVLRVLKPGGAAAVVVQSSYFKDVEIPLGQIYTEMAEALGGVASIARREVVRGHMAHVNSKSSGYVANKVFYEDVVVIQR